MHEGVSRARTPLSCRGRTRGAGTKRSYLTSAPSVDSHYTPSSKISLCMVETDVIRATVRQSSSIVSSSAAAAVSVQRNDEYVLFIHFVTFLVLHFRHIKRLKCLNLSETRARRIVCTNYTNSKGTSDISECTYVRHLGAFPSESRHKGTTPLPRSMVLYGIVGFNVPLYTLKVISETILQVR